MALKLKYTDEHGILHINMSPASSPNVETDTSHPEIKSPTFDSINNRFGQYDLFGTKYQSGENGGSEAKSLFRSRYNSIEEELANTPYAFTDRNNTILDIKLQSEDSPSKDIEDDKFFNKFNLKDDLFGPQCDFKEPAFSVTQLIHAQDRYFDLSNKQCSVTVLSDRPVRVLENNRVKKLSSKFETQSAPGSAKARASDFQSVKEEAFRVLSAEKSERTVKEIQVDVATKVQAISTPKKKKESSFAILTETTISSRPSSPRSLPIEPRIERIPPFRGRGFREETSRHNTPRTSTSNSRDNSPPRRRTNSLSRIEMAATAVPPLPINLSRPHSPRNFVKQNIEEVRELSELNREKHEAEAEEKRRIEEEALLREMGLIDTSIKTDAIRSVVGSRNTSRSNSPSKINLRSRSNSPSAILHFEKIASDSTDFINPTDGAPKATHRSRVRSVSRSQPQSNNGSPKHSKIPKRQNSVSPPRNGKREGWKKTENNLNKNQRFISISTSSINDATRIAAVSEKKGISKSSQHLSISPSNIRGKPPISPGRGGPPPSNKTINAKRLSPIVGTPNRSPIENSKPGSARTPKASPGVKKPNKTAGNTPSTSRVTSRQHSRAVSPDKKTTSRPALNTRSTVNKTTTKTVSRTPSTKTNKTEQKPIVPSKPEVKKPISRTNSVKNLTRTPSTKTLNERPPTLKRKESRKDMMERAKSNTKINEVGSAKAKKDDKKTSVTSGSAKKKPETVVEKESEKETSRNNSEDIATQDNETQYDSITNEKGELVILTKKSIVSMTTAAITAQPLEVVTTVTNQLPAALEKAREKGIFERHSSKDSIAPKDESLDNSEDKKIKKDTKNETKNGFNEENGKLKLLQPPYNNPQVERVKQKIDDILKTPEVSTENILNTATIESQEVKNTLKSIANKTRNEIKDKKDESTKKFTEIKEEIEKQAEKTEKEGEKFTEEVRTEATKIVDSIITPVEEPEKIVTPEKAEQKVSETKIDIEPIITVVNEKVKSEIVDNAEVIEKVNESLVKGDPEVEVQSSNVSTPVIKVNEKKEMVDGSGSDHSTHSNGGFPQSTSTTPKPPARTKKETQQPIAKPPEAVDEKKQNICQRLLGKCAQKTKCCSCCVKPQVDEETSIPKEQKTGMAKWSCLKKNESQEMMVKDIEITSGKLSTIEFQNETKKKRTFREIFCGCCRKSHRVGDSAAVRPEEQGCFGRRREPDTVERRDSILSDKPPSPCCNNRVFNWFRGACRKQPEVPERRPSIFSKNKSLSPTLPPEDTRPKLDPSLIEHTSVMRGAIPVLPISLAYFCLVCNIVVPGLGTILSGLFCLCFGIPRFGIHDGVKHRFGSFVINLLVGCGQLFTVLFCLVGWGWSIWWGVIMIRVSRKYRKLAAEAAMEEEQAPPVTANNHNSRA